MRSDLHGDRISLSECAEVSGGVTLGRTVPAGASVELPYLRVANVQDGYIDTSEVKTIRILPNEIARFGLLRGDVLLTEGGDFDKLGRGAVWDGHIEPCLHQNHVFRVRCDSSMMLPEFLSLYMASAAGRRYFLGIAKQTTNLATINSTQLKSMPVPCPSMSEQHRIFEIINAVNDVISIESHALSKELAAWNGVVNDQLARHAEEYGRVRLEDVSMNGGEYGSNSPASPYNDNLPRYVRITDIDDHGQLSTELKSVVSLPQETARPYILGDGDLLIARTGFTTGKTYLYRREDGLCAYAGYLVRFRLDQRRVLPEYAFLWTRGNAFKRWIAQNVREVGQRNISAREYNGHLLAVPPLEVQQALIAGWEDARATIQLREQKIARLETLKRALADDLLSGKATQ